LTLSGVNLSDIAVVVFTLIGTVGLLLTSLFHHGDVNYIHIYRGTVSMRTMTAMKDYDNFFVPATDLKKAKKFYHDVLELPVKFDFSEKGMMAFQVGNQEPAIIVTDTSKFPAATHAI